MSKNYINKNYGIYYLFNFIFLNEFNIVVLILYDQKRTITAGDLGTHLLPAVNLISSTREIISNTSAEVNNWLILLYIKFDFY